MSQIDRKTGLQGNAAIKLPVKAATTANITLSGEQTIDGVACVTDDRVLVKDQTDLTENGVFIVDTSTWNRAPDFDGANDVVKGTMVLVVSGTVNGPSFWQVTSDDPLVPGTSEIEFAVRANTISGVSAFVNTLLDDTTATTFLATLGLTISTYIKTLLDDADSTAARETLGAHNADNLSTGSLSTAIPVKIDSLRRSKVTDDSSAVGVNSTATVVGTLDLGSLSTGDEILLQAHLHGIERSSAGGQMEYQFLKSSGAGEVYFGSTSNSQLRDSDNLASDTTGYRNLYGMATVRIAGAVAMQLRALSAGSTSLIDSAYFSADVYRNST